jgi:DNA-binding beta-propeller fold protein YncE
VKKVGEVPVGRFPEGVGFSKDGKWAYVGDLLDDRVTILKIDGQKVTDSGKTIKLPGHPASLRTQLP